MQAINVVVHQPQLHAGVLRHGASCACALLVAAYLRWNDGGGKLLLLGSLLHLVGTIGVTMVFNVPLNNALAAAKPETAEAATLWAHYLDRWTMWNTVRTVAPTAAMILFVIAHARAPCARPAARRLSRWLPGGARSSSPSGCGP